METTIRQAFVDIEGIGPHVANGHYDLLGPNDEIIPPHAWNTVAQPGWSIRMQMWRTEADIASSFASATGSNKQPWIVY